MSERIDHAEEAQEAREEAWASARNLDGRDFIQARFTDAQISATLALVEQQRIANLLTIQVNQGMHVTPEIAAALGIKEKS